MTEAATGPARPRMIFHAPYPIPANPQGASRLRPKMMRAAFAEAGYDVFDISGTVRTRKARYRELKRLVKAGERFDFLYFENSTHPNVLADSVKRGIAPFLDHRIHRFARRHAIPVGIFYRDCYWKYRRVMGESLTLWARVSDLLQHLDWAAYRHNRVHFFLPSRRIASVLGLDRTGASFSALPPGAAFTPTPVVTATRLFYVGGVGPHYRFHTAVRAAIDTDTPLRICTAAAGWDSVAPEYDISGPVTVTSGSGPDLEEHYRWCGIGMLALEPQEYRSFAAPVKLFEYLGHGKPILVTAGTNAAEIVTRFDAGWVVDYDRDQIAQLLRRLSPGEIAAKADNARRAGAAQTWLARAREVATTLTGSA